MRKFSLEAYQETLCKFKQVGFELNPRITDSDLIKQGNFAVEYYPNPVEALYIGDRRRTVKLTKELVL